VEVVPGLTVIAEDAVTRVVWWQGVFDSTKARYCASVEYKAVPSGIAFPRIRNCMLNVNTRCFVS
jgi:hypothetical protein